MYYKIMMVATKDATTKDATTSYIISMYIYSIVFEDTQCLWLVGFVDV